MNYNLCVSCVFRVSRFSIVYPLQYAPNPQPPLRYNTIQTVTVQRKPMRTRDFAYHTQSHPMYRYRIIQSSSLLCRSVICAVIHWIMVYAMGYGAIPSPDTTQT
jgi:hypothetical protein